MQQGGVLQIGGSGSLAGGAVQGGAGGVGADSGGGGFSGQAFATGIFVQGDNAVTFDPGPGQIVTFGDVIGDQSGSDPSNHFGQPGTGAVVVTGGGFVGFNGRADFTGGVTIEGGSTASLAFDAAGSGAIRFAGAGTAELQVAPIANSFSGFERGDAIDALGLAGATGAYDPVANTLTLNTPGGTVPIVFSGGAYTQADFAINDSGNDLLISFACFTAGARILTDAGERAVEELKVGERLPTLSGRVASVVWIGQQDARDAPVRIRAQALAPETPHTDLLLSPDHAVFVDGALIPVRHLVDGVTVVHEPIRPVAYFHVELTAHDVIFANGLANESYLDTGNRCFFQSTDQPASVSRARNRCFMPGPPRPVVLGAAQ